MTAQLTVITSRRPAMLSKTVRRGPDGSLLREGGGLLVEGNTEIATVSSLGELAALLQRLGPAQALTFGLPRGGDGRIVSRAALAREGCAQGILTRTRDRFAWPDGPGILMLDHDPDEVALSREELVRLIRTAAPGLADVAMLWWPSASSHICDAETGQDLTGLRGQRMYLLVREAGDIPRAGAALVDRFWAAGHGRIIVSAAGAALERCPVDGSVWQPERLDFAAGAGCGEGLVQRRGAPLLIPGSSETVDTRIALPDDPAISRAAAAARRRARADAADAIEAAREGFLDEQGKALLAPEDREDPEKREAARTVIRRAVENNVLTADFPVEVETAPGHFETITVGRILDDRAGFHGRLTRDPLEPGYDGGRATGKLFLIDSRPTLFSFAHHGRSFRLVRSPERIEVVQGRLAAATESALGILRSDPAVFDFGGQVVLVEDGRMLPLDEHALGYYLAGGVQFWQHRKAGGDFIAVDIDPPAKLVRQILSLGPRRQLKSLSAIVTAPTIRPDGSVLAAPGYDAQTSLLVVLRDEAVDVPPAPARGEITRALTELMYPFGQLSVGRPSCARRAARGVADGRRPPGVGDRSGVRHGRAGAGVGQDPAGLLRLGARDRARPRNLAAHRGPRRRGDPQAAVRGTARRDDRADLGQHHRCLRFRRSGVGDHRARSCGTACSAGRRASASRTAPCCSSRGTTCVPLATCRAGSSRSGSTPERMPRSRASSTSTPSTMSSTTEWSSPAPRSC